MMSGIDTRAAVGEDAILGENVSVGPFAIIEDGAVIGDGCQIAPHAHLTQWARLGNDVRVFTGAVIGSNPQDLKFAGEDTTMEVGDRTVIREYATLNRGTNESGSSTVGEDCLLMAYSHVAHDCHIGNRVIMANSVNMAGHVTIEDWVIIGGMVPIHQFVHLGQHSFIGGGWRVPQDVPPYTLVAGDPLEYRGVNAIGLRRRGFSNECINAIKHAYKIIYRSNLNVSQAMESIKNEVEMTPEIKAIVDFVENDSERGIVGRAKKASDF
ncbi:MAG TPA: acyl-ACP--UDP-N-acetylglucosamine O-acyltransferase [Bacteroidetes bacterium]|nr:acyl-[acyl-carrier-protein]--UDP-N-acetylglucosamine O-acyltransferase [bacterium BMS3Bbin04]HDO65312.1 acyl-ACP--UDP-N-acetylglucosamine O-acyltransferase [Bacteroidota bacterium]HEX04437.1 acyl-ACP--UDP-N-acetylglucosamine O-acyltransferase [Bacteroidota bacterium]